MARVNNIDLDRLAAPVGARVLDLGCARGEQTLALAEHGLRMTGADVDLTLLDVLEASAAERGVPVDVVLLDVKDGLGAWRGAFDAVVCTEVLEHVPDYRRAMEEIVLALRPGGTACIAVPTAATELLFHRLLPTYVRDSTHVNVFTRRLLLDELERAGLVIDHVEGRNADSTAFWIVHGIAGTRFDHTGTPVEHHRLSETFWRWVGRLRLSRAFETVGNRLFPRSLYVYAHTPPR